MVTPEEARALADKVNLEKSLHILPIIEESIRLAASAGKYSCTVYLSEPVSYDHFLFLKRYLGFYINDWDRKDLMVNWNV